MKLQQVILVSVVSSATTMLLAAFVVNSMMPGWRAHLALEPQILQVRLPEGAPVKVDITEPIQTQLKTVLDVEFPIDEVLPLEFETPMEMEVEIDAMVPMQTVIRYESTLPLKADVTADIFGFPIKVPVSGNIPVKLYVPIDQDVPIKFKAPIKVSMDKALQVPIKLDFKTQIPLDQAMSIPVTKPLETNLLMSDRPVTVEMIGSDMVVPLDSLRLEKKPADKAED